MVFFGWRNVLFLDNKGADIAASKTSALGLSGRRGYQSRVLLSTEIYNLTMWGVLLSRYSTLWTALQRLTWPRRQTSNEVNHVWDVRT